jgi:hypothetical protein
LRSALLILFSLCLPARPEVIDRVVVTVDKDVITESDIRKAIRLSAFLAGEPADFSAENRKKMASTLVDQLLLRREMEFTHFPPPKLPEAEQVVAALRKNHGNGDPAVFKRELAKQGIREDELVQYLLRVIGTSRFIDLRFGPEVQLNETEVRNFCDTEVIPSYKRRGLPEPSFDDLRAQCERELTQRRADSVADRWLKETRERVHIVYREGAFT